jgi:hypothetical protein
MPSNPPSVIASEAKQSAVYPFASTLTKRSQADCCDPLRTKANLLHNDSLAKGLAVTRLNSVIASEAKQFAFILFLSALFLPPMTFSSTTRFLLYPPQNS